MKKSQIQLKIEELHDKYISSTTGSYTWDMMMNEYSSWLEDHFLSQKANAHDIQVLRHQNDKLLKIIKESREKGHASDVILLGIEGVLQYPVEQ